MHHVHMRRRLTPILAGLLAVISLAACGSSSTTGSSSAAASAGSATSSSQSGSGTTASRSRLAACLKQHGVTLPARPAGQQAYGGGFFGGSGGTGQASRLTNPKFRAAFQACGGSSFTGRRTAISHTAIVTFAACVKQHGYALPAPNFTGHGPVFPSSVERNSTFQKAERPCASDLQPPHTSSVSTTTSSGT